MQTHIFVNIWIELQSLKLQKPVHLLSPEFPKSNHTMESLSNSL